MELSTVFDLYQEVYEMGCTNVRKREHNFNKN